MVYSHPKPARSPLICGPCRECCKGPRELIISEPGFLYHSYQRDGLTYLATHRNGDCVYLTLGGCGIYEWRPEACRQYDCRNYVTNPGMALRIRLQAARRMTMAAHPPSHPKPRPTKKKKKPHKKNKS